MSEAVITPTTLNQQVYIERYRSDITHNYMISGYIKVDSNSAWDDLIVESMSMRISQRTAGLQPGRQDCGPGVIVCLVLYYFFH